jgi:hypothetical protein
VAKWSKETPLDEGWYWIKYRNKRNKTTMCPAEVYHFEDKGSLVQSARNDTWMEGPNHGGPGLKYHGKLDKTIRFGPRIEVPE